MNKPIDVQLRRTSRFVLPPNTVVVARPGPWGNPFIAGRDGTAARCVELYRRLLEGLFCGDCKFSLHQQRKTLDYVKEHIGELRGKNLACWCAVDTPCHRDVLLEAAALYDAKRAFNSKRKKAQIKVK